MKNQRLAFRNYRREKTTSERCGTNQQPWTCRKIKPCDPIALNLTHRRMGIPACFPVFPVVGRQNGKIGGLQNGVGWICRAGCCQNCTPGHAVRKNDEYLLKANIQLGGYGTRTRSTGTSIRTGITQVCQNFLSNPMTSPWHDEAQLRGYNSSIAICIRAGSQLLGSLTIYSSESNAFNADEVELLEELAGDLAWGIAALRLRAEYEHAADKLRQSEEHFRF